MASSKAPLLQTFKAGSAITKFTFVKFGADKDHVIPAGLNDRPIGIAQVDQSTTDAKVEVAMPGGGGKLSLGMTVVLAQRLYSDASGLGKKVDGASKMIGAIAYQDGVSGDVIDVEVTVPHESVATD